MLGGGGHALCFVNLGLLKLTNSFGIFLSGRSTRRIAEYFELHLRDGGGISAVKGIREVITSSYTRNKSFAV